MSDDIKPCRYEAIALSNESTVVAEFIPDGVRETAYQSEAELEKAFIGLLQDMYVASKDNQVFLFAALASSQSSSCSAARSATRRLRPPPNSIMLFPRQSSIDRLMLWEIPQQFPKGAFSELI
jgi:hypothetical protein